MPEAYVLPDALAPHEAARRAGIAIDMAKLVPPPCDRPLVVEGAGGLMVPLDDQFYVIDLARDLGLPLILVARSTLGTINHTLLSLEAIRRRGLPLAGVVINGPETPHNRAAIERYGQVEIIAEIPRLDPLTRRRCSPSSRRSISASSRGQRHEGRPEVATSGDVLARDRRHVWHPFTQHGPEGDPTVISRAKAASLFDSDGREILDLISSWWTCTHGHSHPKLNAALAAQARRFEHVMFAGFTHEPAVALAAR